MITVETIVYKFILSCTRRNNLYRNHGISPEIHAPFEMLNRSIADFYEYTGENTDFKAMYSFNEFINLFYDAVCYDAELPEYVQEKFIIYFDSPEIKIEKKIIYSAIDEIRTCIVQTKLNNAIKDFWIKDNDRKTKKVHDLIFRNRHKCNSAALVRPLITWAENHNRLTYEFIYKMFEYGYIMGKRAERTRKKTIRKYIPPTFSG